MANILPNDPPFIPRFGHHVLINVGEPIDLAETLQSVEGKSAIQQRKVVTDFIQMKMKLLREETMEIQAKIKFGQ